MLTPDDDYVHPVGPEPNFNESMYFHFFDPDQRIGGFLRLANRPNEGRGERTVCLYLPDGSVAFGFDRPVFADPAQFSAGGMTVDCPEPFRRLQVRFEGPVNLLSDPMAMVDPKAALSASSVAPCAAELTVTGLAPAYHETFDGDGESFAPNHYEQLTRVTGMLTLGEASYPVTGHGLRDHSWGPRSWQAPWFYRWLHGSSAALGFMGAYFGDEDGGRRTGGFVWDGTQVHRCDSVTVSTRLDAAQHPRTVTAELRSGERRWVFTGQARSSVPLRHRRADGVNATRIAEASVGWTAADGTRLHGMAEYLDQIVDGLPVGHAV
ncbi:DUF7065 domain-containing protein [Mycolicibacterium sp.]|uniref:DUF7065 domain-containing protein n=2 Tax=Mycolicibacterium sp. TaxID=2320850 RepID=UPI003D0AE4A4